MITFLLMTVLAVAGLLLQTTLLHGLCVGEAVPDVLLVLCVYLGLYRHTVGGAVGAFALGYLEDSASGGAIGLNASAMCLVFSLVYLTSRRLWVENPLSRVAVVFLASMVKTTGVWLLGALFASLEVPGRTMALTMFLHAIGSAVIALPILALLRRAQRAQEQEGR